MTDTDFKAWVDRLVQTCLPLETQKKLLSLQPLTKEEAKRYIDVVTLVAQTKQLGIEAEILTEQATSQTKICDVTDKCDQMLIQLSRIEKRQLDHGKTLHQLDIHTSPPLENLTELFKDNTEVQRNMFIAGFKLMKSKQYDHPRTAATVVFDYFKLKQIRGRYENKKSFCTLFARKWNLYNNLPRA